MTRKKIQNTMQGFVWEFMEPVARKHFPFESVQIQTVCCCRARIGITNLGEMLTPIPRGTTRWSRDWFDSQRRPPLEKEALSCSLLSKINVLLMTSFQLLFLTVSMLVDLCYFCSDLGVFLLFCFESVGSLL